VAIALGAPLPSNFGVLPYEGAGGGVCRQPCVCGCVHSGAGRPVDGYYPLRKSVFFFAGHSTPAFRGKAWNHALEEIMGAIKPGFPAGLAREKVRMSMKSFQNRGAGPHPVCGTGSALHACRGHAIDYGTIME